MLPLAMVAILQLQRCCYWLSFGDGGLRGRRAVASWRITVFHNALGRHVSTSIAFFSLLRPNDRQSYMTFLFFLSPCRLIPPVGVVSQT